jgi:hypothetical protein
VSALNPLHPEESSILELLAGSPQLTVQQLHERLAAEYDVKMSLQNLYRKIAQLIEAQMLVRAQGKLALHHVWLSHLLAFSKKAKECYRHLPVTGPDISLEDGEEREFSAESLSDLDPLWSDVLLRLVPLSRSRVWYAYNSHPWYLLGMPDTEMRVFQGLIIEGIELQMLYGGTSFLDEYAVRKVKMRGLTVRTSSATDFPAEGYNLWVCGRYLVECAFPPAISNHFAFFFRNVHSIEQFELGLFSDLFHTRARCTIKVRRDKVKSAALAAKLRPVFER